ncbi:hypothetical protein ACEWY4_004136 [Coilia grayii]|uniref:ZP domain-containing protein n=1 Tax=Coilia grayii TaxID=363190 RepID=A0ABD1KKM5_9TELE
MADLSIHVDDPCENYTVLDEPWRATNYNDPLNKCDRDVPWRGWYRLMYKGQNIRMPEYCVPVRTCGTVAPLWMDGAHPGLQDGIVTRDICRSNYLGCCSERQTPIQVKACPGNFYVYQLVPPKGCNYAYCADVNTISMDVGAIAPTAPVFDPCTKYSVLDEPWRATNNTDSLNKFDGHVMWYGWYRMMFYGKNIRMPESCVGSGCGAALPLWINQTHPGLQDGIVTRYICERCGSDRCSGRQPPIQVKACPGNFYVYRFVPPKFGSSAYCADVKTISTATDTIPPNTIVPDFDPCLDYTVLDEPWRATNYTANLNHCDRDVPWHGWYRLMYNGQSIRMSDSCVPWGRCGTAGTLWMAGTHPGLQDGIVTRDICKSEGPLCCSEKLPPIQVKACPGNFYVYQLVRPKGCNHAYCADVNTISMEIPGPVVDPCEKYSVLDEPWRATNNTDPLNKFDGEVMWYGWYRMMFYGKNIRMPESCVWRGCGAALPLWINETHPGPQDGIVTRYICEGCNSDRCSGRQPPIQVKACPGNFYVYRFVPPKFGSSAYCADVKTISMPTDIIPPQPIVPDFDPCHDYTVLDEPWRATNYSASRDNCDSRVKWRGWYRFFHYGQSIHMLDHCMPSAVCGTSGQLWMNGTHPGLQDGIVTRTTCQAGWDDCCKQTNHHAPVQVKACPGNFYVYKISRVNGCNFAFCTDVNTIPVAASTTPAAVPTLTASTSPCHNLHCTEDEICGEVRGICGCLCKDNHHRPNPESFGFVATCHNSSGLISLSRCLLFEAGFSAQVLHLNNPDCKGTVQDGRVEFHFNNDDQKCGTQLKTNETHFIYENSIQGKADSADGRIISRERLLNLEFVCEYPLKQSASMDMAVHALTSITQLKLPPGTGTYQIQMIPYEDADFTQLFSGAVAETSDEKIYISVDVDGADSRQFSSVLDLCWATPTNNSASSITWSLITKQCANPEDGTVEVLRNGVSTSSRFSFRMFTFDGHSPQLYLHCSLHLCLLDGNSCAPNCKSGYQLRVRRSADKKDTTTVSFGPLSFRSGKTDVVDVMAAQAKRYRPKV